MTQPFALDQLAPVPWGFAASAVLVLVSMALDVYFAGRFAGGDAARDRSSCRWLVLSLTSNITLGFVLTLVHAGWITWQPELLAMLGVVLGTAGLGLRYVAVATLGRFFTWQVTVFDDHTLVRRGVFAWLRHPGYSGGLIAGIGLMLALGNWLALLIFLCTHLPLQIHRIRVEERVLLEHFGDDYRAYQDETRALVPFVY